VHQLEVIDAAGCNSFISIDNSITIQCTTYFNQDNLTRVLDFLVFSRPLGAQAIAAPNELKGDNAVSVADLLMFIAAFGDMYEW
jgi:hypothetical protein